MSERAKVDRPVDALPPRGDVAARVIDRLRMRIGEERLRPGDILPNGGDVAAMIGVSRVAVPPMAALGILGGGRRARVRAAEVRTTSLAARLRTGREAAAIEARKRTAAERLMAEHFDETTRMLLRGGIT